LFGLFNRQKQKSGLLGISFNEQELSLAHVYRGDEGPMLGMCEVIAAETPEVAVKELTAKVQQAGLQGFSCNFVLSPADYNLLLIEAPAVEESELAAAAKWKIRDMIDKPLDQLAVVVFPVAEDAYRNQRKMLYVVAADKVRIDQAVNMVVEAGLNLEYIDIPELAMLNLTSLYLDDSNGVAMLDLRKNGSLLNLCKSSSIYLTRHLNTQMNDDMMSAYEWGNIRERLVLEVQRSLDYYASQMRQNHINKLVLAPRKSDSIQLADQLKEDMGVNVEVMNLEHALGGNPLPLALQQSCLMAMGGALKLEMAA